MLYRTVFKKISEKDLWVILYHKQIWIQDMHMLLLMKYLDM